MALPLATLPAGFWLFQSHLSSGSPCSPSSVAQAESCLWEPLGALGVCPGAAKGTLPSASGSLSGCPRALRGDVIHPQLLKLPWHLCHQCGFLGAVRNRVNTLSMAVW